MHQGHAVLRFRYGLLPRIIKHPVALILNNYDLCKPEIKRVFNESLWAKDGMYIPESNKLIKPNAGFRLFTTCNAHLNCDVNANPENAGYLNNQSLVVNTPNLHAFQLVRLITKIIGPSRPWRLAFKIVEFAYTLYRSYSEHEFKAAFTIENISL